MTMRHGLSLLLAVASAACGSSQKCPEPPPPVIVPCNAGPAATTSTGAPAPTTPNQAPAGVFHIEVAKDGSLSIEGAAVGSPKELGERARASAKDRPDLLVIVAADMETPFGHVLNAYEIAKQSGFTRVIIGEGRIPQTGTAKPQQSVPQLLAGDNVAERRATSVRALC